MSLVKSIDKMFADKKTRGWPKLYIAIDLHGVIIKPGRKIKLDVYPEAEKGLTYLSQLKDVTLILFTSTHVKDMQEFYDWCDEHKINFEYLNCNHECAGGVGGDYTHKFYFNLLLDDRAGFDYETDWYELIDAFKRNIE